MALKGPYQTLEKKIARESSRGSRGAPKERPYKACNGLIGSSMALYGPYKALFKALNAAL